MSFKIKHLAIIFFALFLSGSLLFKTSAQTETPVPTIDTSALQQQIKDYQTKISELQGQEHTLSSQIQIMDNQISLTTLRINSTKQQLLSISSDISTTNKKISILEDSLKSLTKILLNRIVATYEVGSVEPLQILLSSQGPNDFLTRANYLRIAQAHDKRIIYDTQQTKNDYANQKNIFEDKKKKVEELQIQLEAYNAQLDSEKAAKKQLLADTQGSEANYQKLLAQAQAQLAGFSSFTAAHGGASILSNQTVCDDWGCYYNQRDSQWGSTALNHTQYTLASDGCLVTSMAMVYTHYGHKSVTPQTINSDPGNFASYYPAYLKYTISADGATSSRVGSIIDGELSGGRPVVVGVGGGPDHFVVLISGSGGNYKMNDPFVPNGHDISFADHYSISSISEVDKVVF